MMICGGAWAAETYYWVGGDTLITWNTFENWKPNEDGTGDSPSSFNEDDSVVIPSGKVRITDFGTNYKVSSISIRNGAALYINCSADFSNTTISNNGNIYFCHNATDEDFTLTLNNCNLGNFTVWGQSKIEINGNCTATSLNLATTAEGDIQSIFSTKITGSGNLTIGETPPSNPVMNLTRCATDEYPNVTGTFEIDANVTCTGTIETQSGVTLLVDSGKTLTAGGIVHTALNGTPTSKIEIAGTLDVGTGSIKLSNGNPGSTQLVNTGTITAGIIESGVSTYNNGSGSNAITNPIINNGTITISNSFTISNYTNTGSFTPYSGTGTIKLNGTDATFENKDTTHEITINKLEGTQSSVVKGGGKTTITTAEFTGAATVSDTTITTAEFSNTADLSGTNIDSATLLDKITLSGANTFKDITASNLDGKTLSVTGTQTITGDVSLSGAGTGTNALIVNGNGDLKITKTLLAEYLNFTGTGPSINSDSTGSAYASYSTGTSPSGWVVVDAAQIVWNGSNTSDGTKWEKEENWLPPSAVPSNSDDIIINAGFPDPVISTDVTVNSITLDSTAGITVDETGSLTITTATAFDEKISGTGTYIVGTSKTFTVASDTNLNINVKNNGIINVSDSLSAVSFSGSGTINLSGGTTSLTTTNDSTSANTIVLKNTDATIQGNFQFTSFSANTDMGGKKIILNNATISAGTITLSGSDTTDRLELAGAGTFDTSTLSANYLSIGSTVSLETFTGSLIDAECIPSAGVADEYYLIVMHNGWPIKALSTFTFTWDGSEDTNWKTPDNWNIGYIPIEDCQIIIPDLGASANYPVIPDDEVYTGGTLSIADGASIQLGTKNLQLTGKDKDHAAAIDDRLSNAGTIIYTGIGRITNNDATPSPINDTAHGTVEYAGTGGGTITKFGTNDYYKLVISGSGWNLNNSYTLQDFTIANGGTCTTSEATTIEASSITFETGGSCTISAETTLQASSFTFGTDGTNITGTNKLNLKINSATADANIPSGIATRISLTTDDGWLHITNNSTGNLIYSDTDETAFSYKLHFHSPVELHKDLKVENDITANESISAVNASDTSALIFQGTGTIEFNPTSDKTYQNIIINNTGCTLTVNNDGYTISNCTITNATATTFDGTPTITNLSDDTTAGDITFNNGATITNAVSLETTGNTTVKGNISAASFSAKNLVAGDTATIDTSTGTQTYTTINGTNESEELTFKGTNITLNGNVGENKKLSKLIIEGTTSIGTDCSIKTDEFAFAGDISGADKNLTITTAKLKSTIAADGTAEISLNQLTLSQATIIGTENASTLSLNISKILGTSTLTFDENATQITLKDGIEVNTNIINKRNVICNGAATFNGTFTNTSSSLTGDQTTGKTLTFVKKYSGTSGTLIAAKSTSETNGITIFQDDVDLSDTTFNASSGTVKIQGTADTAVKIEGNTTFHNFETIRSLTITGSNSFNSFTANSTDGTTGLGGKQITLTAGTTQTISGALTLKGSSTSSRLQLRSSSEGTQWKISCTSSDIKFVDIEDSENESTNYLFALDSWDSGNNTKWNFPGMEYTWTGATTETDKENDWITPTNWNPQSVPGIGAKVTIAEVTNHPILTLPVNLKATYSGSVYEGEIIIAENAIFDIAGQNVTTGTITNDGKLRLYGSQTIEAAMSNGTSTDSTVEYYITGTASDITTLVWNGGSTTEKKYTNLILSRDVDTNDKITVTGKTTLNAKAILSNDGNSFSSEGKIKIGDFTSSPKIQAGAVDIHSAAAITIDNNAYAQSLSISKDAYIQNITTTGTQTYNGNVYLAQTTDTTLTAQDTSNAYKLITFKKNILLSGTDLIKLILKSNTSISNSEAIIEPGIQTQATTTFSPSTGTTTFKSDVLFADNTVNATNGKIILTAEKTSGGAAAILSGSNNKFNDLELRNSTTITGSNQIKDLTVNSADGTGLNNKTILFALGTTQTITGKLTLRGSDSSDTSRLKLWSTPSTTYPSATQWIIKCTGTNEHDIKYVDVKDSDNESIYNAEKYNLFALGREGFSSYDSGNNTNWNFPGMVYTWKGTTSISGKENDWNTATNWLPPSIPGRGAIVVIEEATNDPILTEAQDLTGTYNGVEQPGKITVKPDATFDLAGQNLTVGEFVNQGRVRLTGATGTPGQAITITTLTNNTNSIVEYYEASTGTETSNFAWGQNYENLEIKEKATISAQLAVNGTTTILAPDKSVSLTNTANSFKENIILGSATSSTGDVTLKAYGVIKLADNAKAKNIDLTATSSINIQRITTTETQVFHSPVVLNTATGTADSYTLSGTSITFENTVNGEKSLTLTTTGTGSSTNFQNNVGTTSTLTSLTVNGPLEINSNCTEIKTSSTQVYNGALTLGTSTGTTFSGSQITFNAAVNGTAFIANGPAVIDTATITTTGTQTYNNTVTLNCATTLSGSTVIFKENVSNAASASSATLTIVGDTNIGASNITITVPEFNFSKDITGTPNNLVLDTPVWKSIIADNETAIINLGSITLNQNTILSNSNSANINLTATSINGDGKKLTLANDTQTITFSNDIQIIPELVILKVPEIVFAGNATFENNVLIGTTSDVDKSFYSSGAGVITIKKNLIIDTDSTTKVSLNALLNSAATTTAGTIRAQNAVLYSGEIYLYGNLSTKIDGATAADNLWGDVIILGNSDYTTTDPATGIEKVYYYNQPRPSTPSFNPESTAYFTEPFRTGPYSAILKTIGTANIIAGKNFYSNGTSLESDSGDIWYIQLPKVSDSHEGFAEAIKTTVSNCAVRCWDAPTNTATDDTAPAKIVAYECTDNSGNTNWNFDDFEILNAWTERDDAIFVEFNAPVRNLYDEITNSLTYLTYKGTTAARTAFTGIYTAPDCQDADHIDTADIELTNGRYSLYLKAPDSWNTDATGKSAGTTALSSDRGGNHKASVPYIDIPRSLTAAEAGSGITSNVNYIITNKWGKRLNNYSTRTPTTGFSYGTNETAGSETYVLDKTGPVLWSVRTGQELHAAYSTATGEASQHSYDSHNFLEFRYSEPVSFGSDDASICDIEIPAYSTGTTVNLEENVQVTDHFGAISGTQGFTSAADELTFTGLARLTAPAANQLLLNTGSQGSANKYMNALYRTDEYSLRLSIAGWTDGTVSDYTGNAYKKWAGYIEEANQFTGATAHTVAASNNLVKDQQGNVQIQYAANMTEPVIRSDSTTDNPSNLVPVSLPAAPADLYSQWDLSSPVFTPFRISKDTEWGNQDMSEAIGNTNGSGSTLDRIDFHFFDNTPTYNATSSDGTVLADPAEWFTEIGWCLPGSEAAKENLKDISYTYCADIIGGARQFDTTAARRTTGGIRFSTKADIAPAFRYSTSPNNPSPSTNFQNGIANVHTTIVSQLFTGSSQPMRPANDPDGLYLGLGLTDTELSVETTFAFSYNENLGYLTDLAGNRLRNKVSKTIDRTPPSFDVILSPIDTKSVYIIFVKKLITDSTDLKLIEVNSSGEKERQPINESFADLIPKCFRIITIDAAGNASLSTDIQIDTSVPAEIVEANSNDSFTCLKLTTTEDINIEDLKDMYIQLIMPEGYPSTSVDPFTSNNNSRVTFIQDIIGNYMSMYSAHALSDFAVNYIKPLYAYSSDMLEDETSVMNGLYEEGTWAVHDWNDDQQNYGTLPADHPVSIVADTMSNEKVRIYLSPSPDTDSVSKQFNSDFGTKLRVWLPDITDGIFRAFSASNNTNFVYTDGTAIEDTESSDNLIFNLTKETVSAWASGTQISFMFGLLDDSNNPLRIYNNPYYDIETDRFNLSLSIPVPLYSLRMHNAEDINSLDLWSFKVRSVTEQRGGVTILNNVIDAGKDEKTIIKVNLPEEGKLNVIIMTLDGNIITYLNRGNTAAGEHYFTWNGKNRNGKSVARGMYFVRVIGSGIDETRKVMVVK